MKRPKQNCSTHLLTTPAQQQGRQSCQWTAGVWRSDWIDTRRSPVRARVLPISTGQTPPKSPPAPRALPARCRRLFLHLSPPCAVFQVGFGTSVQHTKTPRALGILPWGFGHRRVFYVSNARSDLAVASDHRALKERTTRRGTQQRTQGGLAPVHAPCLLALSLRRPPQAPHKKRARRPLWFSRIVGLEPTPSGR